MGADARRVTLAVAGWCALAGTAAAQLAWPEAQGFSNSTEVGVEPEAARLAFYRAEEHLAAGRAREAGEEIVRLLRGPTAGRSRVGDRLVVPIETAALLFLARLPAATRAELAREEEAVAVAPRADAGVADLRAFAARNPLLPAGARAWLAAGVRELLAGRFASAAHDLERAVHWPRAPAAEDPTVRRVAAARLLEAHARLRTPAPEEPLASWPEGAVARGGGEGIGLATLRESARAAVALPFEFGDALPRFELLLRPDPSPLPIRDPEYALHRSRFKLVQHQLPAQEPDLKDLPTRAPLVDGDRLITLEPLVAGEGGPFAIRVRSLATGADLFPPIRSDFDLHLDPALEEAALDRAGLSLAGDALFVTLELREPGAEADELVEQGRSARTALARLDLAREGYVDFRVTSSDLAADESLEGFVLAGPALECDGRLLVAASRLRVKDTECALLAFDARDGTPLRATFLARAAAIPRVASRFGSDEFRRVNPSPVALRDGLAFVCTNLGVIGAVRASDLDLAWLFRYHRAIPTDPDRYERSARDDLGPWIGRTPIALPDRVLCTPADSHYLYSLSRWPSPAGHLLLNEPIEKQARLALAGADATRCWFVRQDGREGGQPRYSVEATDHDGAFLWEQSISILKGNLVTGTPACGRRWLFLPTDRCIYRVDLEGGRLASMPPPEAAGVPYPAFGTFGDLALAGDRLVSTSSLFTLVFEPAGPDAPSGDGTKR